MTTNLTREHARRRSATLTLADYEVDLDLSGATDPDRPTFPTRTTLRLRSTEPATHLDFLGESVDAVEVNGVARAVEYDGARVRIEGLDTAADNTVTVRGQARYSRSGEGLHRYVDPADGATYLYTHCEPADCRRVFANLEQPDLKARFSVIVTAPADWQILANQPELGRADAGHTAAGVPLARVRFAPTPPLSTYLVCVAAGPYRRWEVSWTRTLDSGEVRTVPLAALCRASLVDAFDPEEVLRLTKAGLDYFHDEFAMPYPWGKYDTIFVPEYNIGAMENPGLVTFNDALFVFQSGATRSDHEGRATTIMHEMSHMWFGDLVTPRWWDDLWLKESFADLMGTVATAEATEHTAAWVPFCARRKAWAYHADQLPTTHPIVAEIPDVEAAKQNFDGITYAKGAAVLKQLHAYVGPEAFRAGVRRYFAAHAFGCATLADLLAELEAASGRDLASWAQVWLRTTGVATLTPRLELAPDGQIARLSIHQELDDADGPLRPHRITVGLYGAPLAGGSELVRVGGYGVDVPADEGGVEVPEAVGVPAPALVVVDDEDLTYAKVRLDPAGRRVALERLSDVANPLTRAVLWASLWNDCRDARLSAATYVPFVLRHAPAEPDVALVAAALVQAGTATERFVPPGPDRDAMRRRLVATCWEQLADSARGPDHQLAWARACATAALACDARAPQIRELLDGGFVVPGLVLGPQLRWQLWRALAATGQASQADLARERTSDPTSLAPVRHRTALASLPTAAAKRDAWEQLVGDADRVGGASAGAALTRGLTNDLVTALATGFATPGHEALRAPYLPRYLAALEPIWAARSQELAERTVAGLFPDADPGTVAAVREWLDGHPSAPGGLRREVVERCADAERALRAQRAYQLGDDSC